MTQNIWKKGGSEVPVSKKKEYISPEFALSDWIPDGIIIFEEQYPGQLMNAKRQTIWVWARVDPMRGDLTAGVKRNTNTSIEVQGAIRLACLNFLGSRRIQNDQEGALMSAMLGDELVRGEWRLYGKEDSAVLRRLLKCAAVEYFGHASQLPSNYPTYEVEAVRRLASGELN